jgi:hypothetical protein
MKSPLPLLFNRASASVGMALKMVLSFVAASRHTDMVSALHRDQEATARQSNPLNASSSQSSINSDRLSTAWLHAQVCRTLENEHSSGFPHLNCI